MNKNFIFFAALFGALMILSGFSITPRLHSLEAKRVRVAKTKISAEMKQKIENLKTRLNKYKSSPSAYRMLVVYG